MNHIVAAQRLHNQYITRPGPRDPARLVKWMGVVQAQEFGPAKWGLGLRMPRGVTDAHIQRAFDAGRILRTHVLRPTWHFVAPADIRWMVELSGMHIHRSMATYDRRMGLTPGVMTRALGLIERALGDGGFLTRAELGEHLRRAGLPSKTYWLGHIALYAEAEGVICSGPRRGKHSTYALLSQRAPAARSLPRDESLAELARRYFQSHGPATIRDFAWWSGLPAADARRALEMHPARKQDVDGLTYWTLRRNQPRRPVPASVHLLPIYDEFLNAYRDRRAVAHGPSMVASKKGGYGTFQHAVVIGGQVTGTWRTPGQAAGTVQVIPTRRLTPNERRAVNQEVARYTRFVL